jgi:hypothetical protein
MSDESIPTQPEPGDGDWCLVDLSDAITEEATKFAHALGMDFYAFMCLALEEKLAGMRGDVELQRAVSKVTWEPQLKQTLPLPEERV